jgi:hypothetical protein
LETGKLAIKFREESRTDCFHLRVMGFTCAVIFAESLNEVFP